MSKGSGGTRTASHTRKSSNLNIMKITEDGLEDYLGNAKEGRTIQGYIAHVMGNDGKSEIISSEKFERLRHQDGMIAIYRGFRRNEDENINNFKFGKAFDGRGGVGEGSYFATQKLSSFSATGQYVEAILDTRKAKIADYAKLRDKWYNEMTEHKGRMRSLKLSAKTRKEKDDYTARGDIYSDFGRWATAKGYDAVITHDSRFTEYIILDRSVLKVKR